MISSNNALHPLLAARSRAARGVNADVGGR